MESRPSLEVEQLFHAARALAPEEREKLLERVRGESPEIAGELQSLLAALEDDPEFLAQPASRAAERAEEEPPLAGLLRSTRTLARGGAIAEEEFGELLARLRSHRGAFARYQERGEIGRGGMGIVRRMWDGEFEREVAMKSLSARAFGPHAEARSLGLFFKEAKVTGFLDHPGIVPVHELGLDERGGVYFTMRLIRGRELGEVLELAREGRDGWTLTRAIGVLLKICEAMAFAHSKGVVHRDLKPSNVMVGRFGEVYVVDWGIASLAGGTEVHDLRICEGGSSARETAAGVPGNSLATEDGVLVGTPVYMSPEQAAGATSSIGPRTDVYAMGVILYELLTGEPPYAPRSERASPHAVLHRLRQGPPTQVRELAPSASPELEAICEKAMARDPAARYERMELLAEDLQAWLDGRVVRAYEQGAAAALRKWVARNRMLAASILAALVFALGGLGSTAYVQAQARAQEARSNEDLSRSNALLSHTNTELEASRAEAVASAERAVREAKEAERQRASAESVADFLVQLFRASDPELARGREVTAKDLLARGVAEMRARIDDDPLVRARLLDAMGQAYHSIDSREDAEPLLEEAWTLRVRELGPRSHEALSTLFARAELCRTSGELDQAEAHYDELLAAETDPEGELRPDAHLTLNGLARVRHAQGRFEEAERLARLAKELCAQTSPLDPDRLSTTNLTLALIVHARGRLDEAGELFQQEFDERAQRLGRDDSRTLAALNQLVESLAQRRRFAEALPLATELRESCERVFGLDHHMQIASLMNYGNVLSQTKRYEEALDILQRCVAGCRRAFPQGGEGIQAAMHNLAFCCAKLGRFDEASALYEEVLELAAARLPANHPNVCATTELLAEVREGQEDWVAAEALHRAALEGFYQTLGDTHPSTLRTLLKFGMMLQNLGRRQEAQAWFDRFLRERPTLTSDRQCLLAWTERSAAYALDGCGEDAVRQLETLLAAAEDDLGPEHPDTLLARAQLARLLRLQSRTEAADAVCERIAESLANSAADGDPRRYTVQQILGLHWMESGRLEEARIHLEESLEGFSRTRGVDAYETVLALERLARHRLRDGRAGEALALAAEAVDRTAPEADHRGSREKLVLEILRELGGG